jgi:hypothetical protein
MVRLTATIRNRNAERLIVRASAQYYLRPVEAPEAYQQFFATLEQVLFAERATREPLSLEEAVEDLSKAVPLPEAHPAPDTTLN